MIGLRDPAEARRRYYKEYARTHRPQARRRTQKSEWKAAGLDIAECERVYDAASACDICGVPFDGKVQRCLDHDHGAKSIRGVLCSSCNLGLGLMQDDPKLLLKLHEYLSSH